MAQARVVDYFGAKKRSHGTCPSKRRKTEITESDSLVKSVQESGVCLDEELKGSVELQSALSVVHKVRAKTKTTVRSGRTRTSARGALKKDLVGQVKIQDAFAKATGSSSDTDGAEAIASYGSSEISESWDEHDGPTTPKRKIRPVSSLEPPISDSREMKGSRRKVHARRSLHHSPDSSHTIELSGAAQKPKSICFPKKLASSFEKQEMSEDKNMPLTKSSSCKERACSADTKDHVPATKSLSSIEKDAESLFSLADPVPISPLPTTPRKEGSKPPAVVVSPKMKVSMETMKQLQADEGKNLKTTPKKSSRKQAIAPEVVRERLAKCGRLDTLKSKLAEMNSSLRAARKMEAERNRQEADATAAMEKTSDDKETHPVEKKAAPAYERYEYLAREGPPSLALPGKYRRLLEVFQGTDTVVSMLYNRQEVITFSKLQTAVQSMTRKNFEQKMLGQIKTVYPEAYSFRQEKGLPSFGQKVSGYQLTVEPVLKDLEDEGLSTKADGKPNMSAAVLLRRKRIFHNSLINITKDHHADFLSKLDLPLQVSSSKLTRWHPKFALDSVADIQVAELPAAPTVVTKTAQQVLESTMGKLPARVQEAMASVAKKSENSQSAAGLSQQQQKTATPSSPAKPAASAYKGIPQSLLDKIRAKEAAKAQAAMMRDPKEDRKTDMIGRLPNLIRSLRAFYVTEKKPSLPFDTVVQKLADSYATFISPAEVEAHMVLLQELVPKWLQVIQIARGKYVKIDKNADITAIISKLDSLARSRR